MYGRNCFPTRTIWIDPRIFDDITSLISLLRLFNLVFVCLCHSLFIIFSHALVCLYFFNFFYLSHYMNISKDVTLNYMWHYYLSVSSNQHKITTWRGVVDTTLCDKVCQWLAIGLWFSPGTLVSSTNKTDRRPRYNWNIVEKWC